MSKKPKKPTISEEVSGLKSSVESMRGRIEDLARRVVELSRPPVPPVKRWFQFWR